MPNNWATLVSFVITVVRLILVTTPFAIPLTLLYTLAAPGANLFATIGLVLVNLLLYYLSRTNQRSRQRTREMTQLEALGEEIIQSPPDGSTLQELLATHVSGGALPDYAPAFMLSRYENPTYRQRIPQIKSAGGQL